MKSENKVRCAWVQSQKLYIPYHDREWGVPVHDDRLLFEMLNLEGVQAGLSWLTILKRRESYRKAFDSFDAKKIATYDQKKRDMLLLDESIIRNKLKIQAVIENAKAFLKVKKECGSFDTYIWQFVDGLPVDASQTTNILLKSEVMSMDVKKRGFTFVGPTICYAFMQAVGMVNDHQTNCFRYGEIQRLRSSL